MSISHFPTSLGLCAKGGFTLAMQVQIRTNSVEFEFAPNSHDFVDPSQFEFPPLDSYSLRISLNRADRVNR